jgi:hypothetical protein
MASGEKARRLLQCEVKRLAHLGSVAVVAACPLLSEQRKTFARGEYFRV